MAAASAVNRPSKPLGLRAAAAPLGTPVGLADAAGAAPDQVSAARQVQAAYGALDAAWGAVHKTVLASRDGLLNVAGFLSQDPVSGADDPYGPARVVNAFPAPDGSGQLWSYGGDGCVQLVELTLQGAQALLTYGNASRPGSVHVTGQFKHYDAKTLARRAASGRRSSSTCSPARRSSVSAT